MGARVCAEPGCPNLRPCDLHAPKPWASTSARNQARAGSGWGQQRRRQRILRRDGGRCTVHDEHGRCPNPATVVDHVVAIADGGTDTDDNLAGMCAAHHDAKSAAERARGRRRRGPEG